MITKRCGKCGQDKPLAEFHRHRRARDGRQPYCRLCNSGADGREVWQVANARRKAKQLGRVNTLTTAEWLAVLAQHGHHCAADGCEATELEIDHVVPFSAGGTNTKDNVQPLCAEHHVEKTVSERRAARAAA